MVTETAASPTWGGLLWTQRFYEYTTFCNGPDEVKSPL